MSRSFISFLFVCLQSIWLTKGTGMLSLRQQQMVSNYLSSRQSQSPEITMLPARQEHNDVAAEVAMQRSEYTETGQSGREKELLTNIGRLEDQLEGYRRLGPNLHRHFEMQVSTQKTLQELEAKTRRIEDVTASLWWDSKMLMFLVVIVGTCLCTYVSCLHARQNSQKTWHRRGLERADVSAIKEETPEMLRSDSKDVEYFNMAEEKLENGMGHAMSEEDWWDQPCGSRPHQKEPAMRITSTSD